MGTREGGIWWGIKRDNVSAGLVFDIRPCHKRNPFSESLPRPCQHFFLFRITQVIHVAGVHVDGIHQPGSMCGSQLSRKRVDSDPTVCLVRQQGGGNPLHLASRFLTLDQLVNCHSWSHNLDSTRARVLRTEKSVSAFLGLLQFFGHVRVFVVFVQWIATGGQSVAWCGCAIAEGPANKLAVVLRASGRLP